MQLEYYDGGLTETVAPSKITKNYKTVIYYKKLCSKIMSKNYKSW